MAAAVVISAVAAPTAATNPTSPTHEDNDMIIRKFAAFAATLSLILTTAVTPAVAAPNAPAGLRDTETEAFLNRLSAPLANAAGLSPGALKFVILNDPEINAFVAGGQVIYINSGLLLAAESTGEIQGVIAHELGHIQAGDVVRGDGAMQESNRISIAGLVIGAAAMAMGAGDAGMAAFSAGQQGGRAHFLRYSRQVEGTADASAVRYLNQAGVSGRGMISFFEKLKREEWRLSSSYEATDPFMQSHPMSSDRQAILLADLEKSPHWAKPENKADQASFLQIKGKLFGYLKDAQTTLRTYPLHDQSPEAHYARAYAFHRTGYPDKAAAEINALISIDPSNCYFHELKGQILLEAGHPLEAVKSLRQAAAQSANSPLILNLLAQALWATEDPANLPEAEQIMRLSVARDPQDVNAWQLLGTIYAARGDEPRAALASAESYSLKGNREMALINAKTAMRGVPAYSADWLRAQDIEMANSQGPA